MRCSVQPRGRIYVKGYGFQPFSKNMGWVMIMLKHLQQMRLKLLRKEQFKKTAETTCDLIGNKVADRITKVSRNSQQNKSEKVTNEHDKVIHKKKIYITRGKTGHFEMQ